MIVTFYDLFVLSFFLFLSAIWGLSTNSQSVINILISLELLLLSASFNFIIFSLYIGDITGQIYALLILTVAGAESAIGLAILVSFYRLRGDISLEAINSLKA